jgi:phage-related protein
MVPSIKGCTSVSGETLPKVALVFYRTERGREPVRDWLKALDRSDRLEIGADLRRLQFRWRVGMPLCRPMGGGLWEVRTNLQGRRIARVFICFDGGVAYALHAFLKTTRTTPDEELALARMRMKEVEGWVTRTRDRT